MIWLVIVPLIIFWAFIQKHIVDSTGAAPRSRGSFRSQRRKAAKWGIDTREVPYNPHVVPMNKVQIPRWVTGAGWIMVLALWGVLIFWR